MATRARTTLPAPRIDAGYLEETPIELDPQATDALKAAGAGAAIGSLVGAMTGGSRQSTLAGGVAGGAIGLVINSITHEPGIATNLAVSVRQNWRMTRDVFARLVGYAPRTIADYEAGADLGTVPQRRYVEIQRLRSALEGVMKPEFVNTWLNSPNPAFEGSTPMQVIERGEVDRVWASVYYLDSGMS